MSPPNSYHWLSSHDMTVLVTTNPNGVIVDSPPIIRRFIGQPVTNLVFWMQKQEGFHHEEWTAEQAAEASAEQ